MSNYPTTWDSTPGAMGWDEITADAAAGDEMAQWWTASVIAAQNAKG